MKYIYHHLGLGDHIINNGMVRHFYNEYGAITLFAYKHNLKNVQYMYRDLENFQVIGSESDAQIDSYIQKTGVDCIKIGFSDLSGLMPELAFDKAFYKLADLDFSVRFDEFYLERDLAKENEVIEALNPTGEKYVFVHDDSERGYSIDLEKVKTDYKIIMNDKQFNVFDYLTLIAWNNVKQFFVRDPRASSKRKREESSHRGLNHFAKERDSSLLGENRFRWLHHISSFLQ